MQSYPHSSVLLAEVIHAFEGIHLKGFVDGTLGAGGHAQALLEKHSEIEYYLGIDQDPSALNIAKERLQSWSGKTIFKHGNFDQFDLFLKELNLSPPQGILVDLGVSSMQLDRAERGFSFMQEGPLDMRMNPQGELTAADIVNHWSEKELGRIFRDYGEEKYWRIAAHTIVEARKNCPFATTHDLKKALISILGPKYAKKSIHPLTLVFQALRIAVNRELEALEQFLPKAISSLASGGRLAVISFHSLEDRAVKNEIRMAASDKWETTGLGGLFRDKDPIVKIITKKPIEAGDDEIKVNPRSRSAKLRVAEKLNL